MVYSFAAAVLWATTGIFIKFLAGLPLIQLVTLRFILATCCSAAVMMVWRSQSSRISFARTNISLAALMTAYYLFATTAFALAPVSIVVLLIASSPVIAFVLQYLITRLWVWQQLAGLLLTFAGLVLYLQQQGRIGGDSWSVETYVGFACALSAAMVRAVYAVLVFQKTQRGEVVKATALNMITMLIGSGLMLCVFSGWLLVAEGPALVIPSSMNILHLLGLAVLATVLPTLFNTLGSAKVEPVLHNTFGLASPVIAGMLAWMLLDESQNMASLISAVIILGGIALSISGKRRDS